MLVKNILHLESYDWFLVQHHVPLMHECPKPFSHHCKSVQQYVVFIKYKKGRKKILSAHLTNTSNSKCTNIKLIYMRSFQLLLGLTKQEVTRLGAGSNGSVLVLLQGVDDNILINSLRNHELLPGWDNEPCSCKRMRATVAVTYNNSWRMKTCTARSGQKYITFSRQQSAESEQLYIVRNPKSPF